MWIFLIIGAMFILSGLAVHVFKWHFLIAGYNTMSKDRQAKVNVEGLGRLMGIYSYVNGAAFILLGILYALGFEYGLIPVLVFSGISTVYLIIRAQKFDHNHFDEKGKMRKGAGKKVAIPFLILGLTIVFVAVLMVYSTQDTEINLLDAGVEIKGMYGDLYAWEAIDKVQLMDSMPNIEARTNGSAVGSHLKGNFRTTEYGKVKLFVDTKIPPFIFLQSNDSIVIFNMADADETRNVYQDIMNRLK